MKIYFSLMASLLGVLISLAASVSHSQSDLEENLLEAETEKSRHSELVSTQNEHNQFERDLQSEIRQARGQALNLNKQNRRLEFSIARDRKQIERLSVVRKNLKGSVSSAERKNSRLSTKRNSLQARKEKLSTLIGQYKNAIHENNTQAREMKVESDRLQRQVAFQDSQLRLLRRKLEVAQYERRKASRGLVASERQAARVGRQLQHANKRGYRSSSGTAALTLD